MAAATVDPFEIFVDACAFWKTAALAGRIEYGLHYKIPMLVLEVFSLELHLKCLHALRGNRKWGHDIGELFSDLPDGEQAAIAAKFQQQCAGRSEFASLTLAAVLDRSKELFEKARYRFEGEEWNPDASGERGNRGFDRLIRSIHDVIEEQQPDWHDRYQTRMGTPGAP